MAKVKLFRSQHKSPNERQRGLPGEYIRFVRLKDLPDTFMGGMISTNGEIEKADSQPGESSKSEPMVELVWRTDTQKFFSLDWRNLDAIQEHEIDVEDIPASAPMVEGT